MNKFGRGLGLKSYCKVALVRFDIGYDRADLLGDEVNLSSNLSVIPYKESNDRNDINYHQYVDESYCAVCSLHN